MDRSRWPDPATANLLAQGRERAAAEHLPVTFTEGDGEKLPVPDQSFARAEYLEAVGVRR